MNATEANTFLKTEKIGKLMRKYAVPCVVSLLVAALYNIVDQIFIANASYLGSYGNAANTVVFPLTVVALAIAVMIGRRLLCFCQHQPWGKRDGESAPQRWKCNRAQHCRQHPFDGGLSDFHESDSDGVRRYGK